MIEERGSSAVVDGRQPGTPLTYIPANGPVAAALNRALTSPPPWSPARRTQSVNEALAKRYAHGVTIQLAAQLGEYFGNHRGRNRCWSGSGAQYHWPGRGTRSLWEG
jgi:hypothetical protein